MRLWVVGALCASGGLLAADAPVNKRGEVIYQKLCLECHGKNGGGVKDKYDEPLHGNRTVDALAKRIARTMPDDDVGACVGEDAKDVAAYIYDAFYSPSAQARLQPPEFDLARLTIAQYRTSVADVLGRFRPGF
ncbi:MAG: cytochrome c, partial [Verrucomicrobiaceae bacterium]|nr:cytochrome c [Verrucomicrobiaceae bacterium]